MELVVWDFVLMNGFDELLDDDDERTEVSFWWTDEAIVEVVVGGCLDVGVGELVDIVVSRKYTRLYLRKLLICYVGNFRRQ